MQGYLIGEGCANPLENFWNKSGEMFVIEKVVSWIYIVHIYVVAFLGVVLVTFLRMFVLIETVGRIHQLRRAIQ